MHTGIAILLVIALLQPAAFGRSREMSKEQQIDHALSRLTWGVQPGDEEAMKRLGVKKWIDRQLHPESITESPELQKRLDELPALKSDTAEMFEKFRERKQESIRPIVKGVTESKIYRAVYTNRQLEDVLTDFWFNHFNVFMDKGADRVFTGPYERDAIRPHVLGKFRDLLSATASHPAMLWYLDNWQSVGSDSIATRVQRRKNTGNNAAKNKKTPRGLNENYGRELLELHTLGVEGGYTQKDVVEVARCFTGWTIRQGSFYFAPAMHDRGQKVVLGVSIPAGGGKDDAERVLDILASHPSTAKFVSGKLAQRFVADQPPQSLVAAMQKTFLKTHGDLREVMKTMLESPEFWKEDVYRAKLKTPFELVVSAARAGHAELQNGVGLAGAAAQLGQPLYRKQEPTGYSNSGEEWKNSASLLARMNLATAFAKNRVPGVDCKWPADPLELLPGAPSESLRATLTVKADSGAGVEAVLGSPDFQKR